MAVHALPMAVSGIANNVLSVATLNIPCTDNPTPCQNTYIKQHYTSTPVSQLSFTATLCHDLLGLNWLVVTNSHNRELDYFKINIPETFNSCFAAENSHQQGSCEPHKIF